MPGDIARKRNHPQAQAISALGWIGVITLGLGWFIAIVWAYYKPETSTAIGQDAENDLRQRIDELENQLNQMRAGGSES